MTNCGSFPSAQRTAAVERLAADLNANHFPAFRAVLLLLLVKYRELKECFIFSAFLGEDRKGGVAKW